jgi:hypothetical protein
MLFIMASIHKQCGRAFWYAAYRDSSGKQHLVSTKIPHTPMGHTPRERSAKAAQNRRLALEIGMRLEEAERGNATESHLRKLLSDVSERVNQSRLEFKTVDSFLTDWLGRAQKTKSPGTYARYSGIVKNFLKSLGAKARAKLADITARDVQKFIQDRLEGGRNPSTVRTDCKILNAPFALALRQGLSLIQSRRQRSRRVRKRAVRHSPASKSVICSRHAMDLGKKMPRMPRSGRSGRLAS